MQVCIQPCMCKCVLCVGLSSILHFPLDTSCIYMSAHMHTLQGGSTFTTAASGSTFSTLENEERVCYNQTFICHIIRLKEDTISVAYLHHRRLTTKRPYSLTHVQIRLREIQWKSDKPIKGNKVTSRVTHSLMYHQYKYILAN